MPRSHSEKPHKKSKIALDRPRGRAYLRGLIARHAPNIKEIFRRDDVPNGFNYHKFQNSLNPNSGVRNMNADWHRWIAARIKDSTVHMNSSMLITDISGLHQQAGVDDFKPLAFFAKGEKLVGHAIPAWRLAHYFSAKTRDENHLWRT